MTAEMHVFMRADWMDDAACASKPTRWWYSNDLGDEARAKMVCATCPVIQDCEAYAMARGEEHGIWGGKTPVERGVRRRLGRPPKVLVCVECRATFQRDANRPGGKLYCSKTCANRASAWRKRVTVTP